MPEQQNLESRLAALEQRYAELIELPEVQRHLRAKAEMQRQQQEAEATARMVAAMPSRKRWEQEHGGPVLWVTNYFGLLRDGAGWEEALVAGYGAVGRGRLPPEEPQVQNKNKQKYAELRIDKLRSLHDQLVRDLGGKQLFGYDRERPEDCLEIMVPGCTRNKVDDLARLREAIQGEEQELARLQQEATTLPDENSRQHEEAHRRMSEHRMAMDRRAAAAAAGEQARQRAEQEALKA